ncbi:hypothetical protein IFT84_10150 [Rhizobium sp. CFBP 8762]|uniref:hypothetical protein n=1 Tax=Rhizobium sp. CFBP 8762 TaxID=2775279 RepID=UPI00177E9D4D|nr:hypothetical protein [Rhizobium sp. CFBP 8762]MBD8554885.1 hypothetical protein [Rhizobium sp. CFBP 8762]
MTKPDPFQMDFFERPVFPVRVPVNRIDLDRFRARIKRAMARAIRECEYDRPTIAARMAHYLGLPNLNKSTLDAYTAESRTTHDISLVRFSAFVHATGATWLWDEVVADNGATLLIGDEARWAEIARLREEQERNKAKLRQLTAAPIQSMRGR